MNFSSQIFLLLVFMLSYTVTTAQVENDSIVEVSNDSIAISDENEEKLKDAEKAEDLALRRLADEKVAFFQGELNLTDRKARILKLNLIKYSKEANKILQSPVDVQSKTRELDYLLYRQKEEFKDLFSAPQLYKFLSLTASN